MSTTTITAAREAYEEATGQWTGCDWATDHGATKLDLDGTTPEEARKSAAKWATVVMAGWIGGVSRWMRWPETPDDCDLDEADFRELVAAMGTLETENGAEAAQQLSADYDSAAEWLDECEGNAEAAEDEARQAIEALDADDLDEALFHAHRACRIEEEYGDCPTWRAFRAAMEAATAE